MRDKGLLLCDTEQRPQIFRPKQSRKVTLKKLAGDLVTRVFEGSASLLLQHAIDSKKATPDELAQIRDLLDRLEEKR